MSLASNIIINIYSIIILGIIYFQSSKQDEKGTLQYNLYMKMLQVTVLLLILDILSRFDGKPDTIYPFINQTGNFLIFLFNLMLPSLWILYVHNQVIQKEEQTKKLMCFLVILNILNAIMLIISQFFGWLYYIDSNNIYHRGPFFTVPAIVIISLIGFASIICICNIKRLTKSHIFALVFFAVPPLCGMAIQVLFYGNSMMLIGVVISLLIVFLNIQNHTIYIDYLTKVNNRKKLDLYLKEKINMSTPNKTFSAIMIDLDNFKFINDTYGHDKGDRALQNLVILLERVLKSKDFIARFGGDEFFVVLDVMDLEQLKRIVFRINQAVEKQNEYNNEPFKLSLSMGYIVYDYNSHMELEEFFRKIDALMYENKQKKKHK
ncbi:GGDEF domain-containing protein [Anaerosacchariphilus polymeriproducens]|uniref:GGDEF domain-containing protein n=1 Tax=Anaerosacchariphilus polymeriproducens TaxID=1812858 RepID=A0A371ASH5_9FIRM|nr:GGDEF domain-containing protein [Anaerosacchariphilus polymeriproducens]RDU22527.1 GGDEF domain-containing protein [Anaerosacchariphilus polymeriproducens]